MIGEQNLHCTTQGTWSHDFPYCNVVHCPPLLPPANGHFIGEPKEINTKGDIVLLGCLPNYMLTGGDFSVCQADGEWSEIKTKCLFVLVDWEMETGFCHFQATATVGIQGNPTMELPPQLLKIIILSGRKLCFTARLRITNWVLTMFWFAYRLVNGHDVYRYVYLPILKIGWLIYQSKINSFLPLMSQSQGLVFNSQFGCFWEWNGMKIHLWHRLNKSAFLRDGWSVCMQIDANHVRAFNISSFFYIFLFPHFSHPYEPGLVSDEEDLEIVGGWIETGITQGFNNKRRKISLWPLDLFVSKTGSYHNRTLW